MAISWGAYNGRLRVGIELTAASPGQVTKDTASQTLTFAVYVQSDGYGWADDQVMTMSNAISASVPYSYDNSIGQQTIKQVWSGSVAVTTSYTGPVSRTLTAQVSSAFNGATPSHSLTITVPTRPPQVPSPPTAVTTTLFSDNRIDVAWTKPANWNDPSAFWGNIQVRRYSFTQPNGVDVAYLSGSATGYSDTSTEANQVYQYAVLAFNPSGATGFVNSEVEWTTPATPTNVTAVKGSGGNIVVTWTDDSRASETVWEVQDETTALGTAPTNSYTHTSPNASVTHRYRVRAKIVGPEYTLYSPWSAYSNTVQLLAAPATPSNLSPNGTVVSLNDTLTLSWNHNPVDTTPQEAYELRHRVVGTGTWTTLNGTTAQTRTVTTYTSQANVEWQVRTRGQHATYSPWSALATFTVSGPPTATISSPPTSVTTPSITVGWTYFHAGGSPQSTYQTEIVDNATNVTVAAYTGSGTATTWASGNVLSNGKSYTVRVRVRSTNGLWSAWATRSISVAFTPPAVSTVSAAWQDGLGYAAISARAVTEAGKPATVSHTIERSDDGGNTWETLIEGLPASADYIDWTAPAGGSYKYRITAVSALPSTVSTIVDVTVANIPSNNVIWVSGGAGFTITLPLPYNPDASVTMGRERSLVNFSGRTYPVEFAGIQRAYALSAKATLPPDSFVADPTHHTASATREQLEALFDMPGPHLYRDPSGRVVVGSVSPLSWSRSPGGSGDVSFTITRTAKPTVDQAQALARYYDNEGWSEL